MVKFTGFLTVIVVSVLSACSNQAVYNNLQLQQQQACQEEPTPRAVRECLARVDMSYEQYRRQQQVSD